MGKAKDELRSRVEELQSLAVELEEELNSVYDELSNSESENNGLSADLEAESARADSLRAHLDAQDGVVADQREKIKVLQGAVDTLAEDLIADADETKQELHLVSVLIDLLYL
jgi:uncharacterized coiled-coil DUF342 family protein